MKLKIIAVGNKMPTWVNDGFDEYARRMPRTTPIELIEIRPEPRSSGKTAAQMMAVEAKRLMEVVAGCHVVALDERGRDATTVFLKDRLADWMGLGSDVALVIGGADGLDPAFKATARELLRLSSLTLPHGMVRVILAEALYRAASLLNNHPYHRE